MTTTLTLPGNPEVGLSALVQQQRFECVEIRPYITRAGKNSELAIWQAPCADCGAPFELITPRRKAPVRVDRRRCDLHRYPGRRVNGCRGSQA